MSKVKFKFSIEKITFEYEGDHETGQAISQSMQRTLGSFAEAQNAVIDVTPLEDEMKALPPATYSDPLPKRRKRRRARQTTTSSNEYNQAGFEANGEQADAKSSRVKRSRSVGFRTLGYRLLLEGFFNTDRTMSEVKAKLTEMGFPLEPKTISSELGTFTKRQFLSRRKNNDNVWAFRKGQKNDYPRGQNDS